MKNQPLVSILMTSYNREKYIAEAIKSVLESTYTNFELLIVDDCSKDKTIEIARSYEAKDKRIKIILNEKNLGDYPNRNKAASYAQGKFIKYVDADDLIYPHGLDVMVRAMETYPEAGFALCRPASDFIVYPVVCTPHEVYYEHFFENDIFGRSPLGAIVKTEVFRKAGGFRTDKYHFLADTDLWFRLATNYKMVKMVMGLTHWRNHGNQQSAYGDSDYNSINLKTELAYEHLISENCPLSQHEKNQAVNLLKKSFIKKILILITRGKAKAGFSVYKNSILKFEDIVKFPFS